nr:MAG TPA: hypothetical protein [Caudoviricetes sp.]
MVLFSLKAPKNAKKRLHAYNTMRATFGFSQKLSERKASTCPRPRGGLSPERRQRTRQKSKQTKTFFKENKTYGKK